jgi:glycosyltransferase 2 family protein
MTDSLEPPKTRRGSWPWRLLGFAVFAGAVYLVHRLVAEVGWREVGERLAAARPPIVAVAVACLICQLALWALRQGLSIRRILQTPPGWTIFLALMATAAANFLLPFARLLGGLMRARYLSRASEPPAPKRVYYGAVLFDQAVHFLVMASVSLVGLIGASIALDRPRLAWGLSLGLAAAGIGAFWWARRATRETGGGLVRFLERRAARQQGVVGKLLAGSETAARVFFELAGHPGLWVRTVALGFALFGFVAAAQWTVFAALGTEIEPLVVVGTVSLGLTAGVLLGTPGGLGAAEATMIALYGAFGVDRVDAASAVLLFRGLQFAVVLALGLPSMAALELHAVGVQRRVGVEAEEEAEALEEAQ